MTSFLIHKLCKRPIARFVGKTLPDPGSVIRAGDFILMTGRRPSPKSPIMCPHCKSQVDLDDIYLEHDHAIEYLDTRSD